MLIDKKILVTGVSGQVAFPIAAYLARNNEVWGGARFGDEAAANKVAAAGIRAHAMDLSSSAFPDLPDDFDYVLHFGFMRGNATQFDQAVQVNGEGTGFVMKHCRKAKAALIVSSAAIYSPNEDSWHAHREDGELGRSFAPWSPTSPVTKMAEEAVARFCARAYDLPTTIVRLNTVYGSAGNLPSMHIRQMLAGETVHLPSDPNNHSPIHVDDMCAQVEPLLAAASFPATIVNWAGDEVVSAQRWCAEAATMLGIEPKIVVTKMPNVPPSNIADVTKRREITGPCGVSFSDGLARLVQEHHRGKG